MELDADLQQTNDRRLDPGYRGDVIVFDIDKTYLDTRFSTLRGLASIPFELAVDKRSIPGAVPLLRALRRGPGERSALVPLYFISGSPTQLRPVIERKMTLDGVDFDGITFKDQFGLFRRGELRAIRRQLTYKLRALLLYRRALPPGASWLLFGDDVEDDAEAFRLFADILEGLRGEALERQLAERGADRNAIRSIGEAVEALPRPGHDGRADARPRHGARAVPDGTLSAPGLNGRADARPRHGARAVPDGTLSAPADDRSVGMVVRIFIHLEGGTDPGHFHDPRIVATRSFLETALVLASMDRIRPEAITAVAKDLRLRHVPESTIAEHLADAMGRLRVPPDLVEPARQRV